MRLKRLSILLLAGVVLLQATAAAPVMAANSSVNYDSGAAPQGEVVGDVTIADHPVAEGPLTYNDNNGEWTSLPGSVNNTADNPYSFAASDINFSDATAFPHASKNSWTSAADWTTTVSDTTNTALTVSDVETAPGVDAVQIATGGSMGSDDTATATFAENVSITSDEEKRYLQIVGDVNTLDSGATVDVRVVDEDGDYYNATIDPSASSIDDTTIATQTGEGFVYQQQLGTMTIQQVGDGTFNDIQKVEVVTSDADADVTISALNVDKTGAWDFGDEKVDTDDDDELETQQIVDHNAGAIAIHDLGKMGDTFADAHIKGLTVAFETPLSALPSADVSVEYTEATQYSNYESHFKMDARFEMPDQYDLSYANLKFRDTVSVPGTRYVNVEYAEGTGDTAFDDISSWTDLTNSYSSVGADVTIDDTVQPGSAMVISYDYVVTSEEKSELQQTGGAMGPTGSSGGPLEMIFSLPGIVISGIVGFLGLRSKGWV